VTYICSGSRFSECSLHRTESVDTAQTDPFDLITRSRMPTLNATVLLNVNNESAIRSKLIARIVLMESSFVPGRFRLVRRQEAGRHCSL